MNLRKGFRRLALTLSILTFLVAFVSISNTSNEDFSALFGAIFFSLMVWIVLRLILFVIEGFSGKSGFRISKDEAARVNRTIKTVAFYLAIVGLLAGVAVAIMSIRGINQRYDRFQQSRLALESKWPDPLFTMVRKAGDEHYERFGTRTNPMERNRGLQFVPSGYVKGGVERSTYDLPFQLSLELIKATIHVGKVLEEYPRPEYTGLSYDEIRQIIIEDYLSDKEELSTLERQAVGDLWTDVGRWHVSQYGLLVSIGWPIGGFLLTWVVIRFGCLAIHRWFVLGFSDYQSEVR